MEEFDIEHRRTFEPIKIDPPKSDPIPLEDKNLVVTGIAILNY